MANKLGIAAIISALVFMISNFTGCARNLSERVQRNIRLRIEVAQGPPQIKIGDELIYSSEVLPRFYEQREYMPAWSTDSGLSPQIPGLVAKITGAEGQCFMPDDYHLKKIASHMSEIKDRFETRKTVSAKKLAELDLLLTDAFLIYSAHLLEGRTNPTTRCAEWNAVCEEADLAVALQEALSSESLEATITDLLPKEPAYFSLCQKRSQYTDIMNQGGWPVVPDGPSLANGDRGERVPLIRKHLLITGDLPEDVAVDTLLFDESLEDAVKRFQKRHGMTADGKIGTQTLAAMNVPVDERIRQIEVNMERWRWCQRDFGERHILINIANFELDVYERDTRLITMRAIVGKPFRMTPVFSGKMTYLVINPSWNVPKTIAVEDILPEVIKDIGYLAQNNYRVLRGWSNSETEINPTTVDWTALNEDYFPYRFRQDPGPTNALGRIKFMFPNEYDVYIHDTPARHLFSNDSRDFSSGCIRIQKPIVLCEYVLDDSAKWSKKEILKAIDEEEERTVGLPRSIPVHLLYWTAWVTDDGLLHFRNDIYERDNDIYLALIQPPCAPPQ